MFNLRLRPSSSSSSSDKFIAEWKASYEDYRSFIAISSEGIWRFELEQPVPVSLPVDDQIDLIYRFAYLAESNNAMARMYGYERAEQILGARLDDLMPKSDPKNVEYLRALQANGYNLNDVESSEVDRFGNAKVFLNSASAIVENGMIVRAWGTQRDITAQKQAEAERERWSRQIEGERDRLRRILEQMPIGVVIAEAPSGRLVFHNIEASRLLHGLSQYPAARSLMSGAVIKGEEIKCRLEDASETYFSVNSAPIYDPEGRMALTIVTFMDIAERKRAEAALLGSEERFEKAFQASPDGLVISRIADAVVLEVNDSFLAMSGYARDEIIGRSALQIGLYADPSDRARVLDILNAQNFVRDYELTLKRKSGEVRWVRFSAEPMELRGEHCWLTLTRDITERKHHEEERERLLLQEKAAREEAEAANRMKDEFLATVSHELRTPLTAILGWASMLNRGLLSQFQTHRALQVIEQSARAQAGLVDDILDTARIITGRLRLDARQVAIVRVFQAALDVIRPSADAKRIALQAVIDDQDGIVIGDPNRVQQVIWNLLANAVKFTNEGGRVEARLHRTEGHIEITVTDTGMGIEPEFLPYVFDRFRQADSTSTRKYSGLGLGLAIVRHVVEMHGGTVAASSPGKGQGATFTVRFPVASADTLQQPERQTPRAESKRPAQSNHMDDKLNLDGVRVLVVEDDADTLEMVRVILMNRGAEVVTASSADEALEALDHSRPDALVSDLAMPGQDGYELIEHIRQRGPAQGGNVPAVAMTAYARVEDRVHALTAGYQIYVPKPVDPDELVAVVANLTHRL